MKLLVVNASFERDVSSAPECAVLVAALRALNPTRLDLAVLDADSRRVPNEIEGLVHDVVVDQGQRGLGVAWIGSLFGARWRTQRTELFRNYDAILSAPASLSTDRGAELVALADLDVAKKLGVPFILSSHSIGPLDDVTVERLRLATLCITREDATYAYLRDGGVPCVRGASLAFLYQRTTTSEGRRSAAEPYRALFLGGAGVTIGPVERHDRRLRIGRWGVEIDPHERLLLATTGNEGRSLQRLSRQLRAPMVACRTPEQIVGLVADSSGVISDSFTPAACAVALAKPLVLASTATSHEMLGAEILARHPDAPTSRALAAAGLDALRAALAAPER